MVKSKDQIEKLVDEAHKIFNQTSVFEVVDLDNNPARDFLNEAYDNPGPESIDRYLCVIEKLRWITT